MTEFQVGDKVKLTHSGLKGEIVQIDPRSAFCYKVLFEFQVGEPGTHWVTPENLELTI